MRRPQPGASSEGDEGRPALSGGFPPAPDPAALAALLDAHAPLTPAPLSPELRVFQARALTEVWEAAERVAGRTLPAPFWAYAWAGGSALARVILDRPEWVRGRVVLDVGSGGGVEALAAARAGAARVLINDEDPWAVAVARLAGERQGLVLEPVQGDLTGGEGAIATLPARPQVVLAGDLAYDRSAAPRLRRYLEALAAEGADVLVADAGRAYFEDVGMEEVAKFTLDVPRDLEGTGRRTAVVYRLGRAGRTGR